LTVRQRLAVALSAELIVEDWRSVIAWAKARGRIADLARLADQAFGRPSEQDTDAPTDPGLRDLTPDQRAVLMAALDEAEEELREEAAETDEARGRRPAA
jgi:hypothetical protein